jgi:hypothetical protein
MRNYVAGFVSPSTSVLKAASKGADPTFSGTKSPSIASIAVDEPPAGCRLTFYRPLANAPRGLAAPEDFEENIEHRQRPLIEMYSHRFPLLRAKHQAVESRVFVPNAT